MTAQSDRTAVTIEVPQRTSFFVWAKRGVELLALLIVLPRLITYHVWRAGVGPRAFNGACESIARIPGLRGIYLRQAFYRATLSQCGRDNYFGWNSVLSMTDAQIGSRVYIGRYCSIGFACIEDEVMLADGVQILSGGHEHDEAQAEGQTRHSARQRFQQVRIGRGAWIGAGAIVMADVGENVVVGAGAVVTKPIPAHAIAVGVPARVRGERAGAATSANLEGPQAEKR